MIVETMRLVTVVAIASLGTENNMTDRLVPAESRLVALGAELSHEPLKVGNPVDMATLRGKQFTDRARRFAGTLSKAL